MEHAISVAVYWSRPGSLTLNENLGLDFERTSLVVDTANEWLYAVFAVRRDANPEAAKKHSLRYIGMTERQVKERLADRSHKVRKNVKRILKNNDLVVRVGAIVTSPGADISRELASDVEALLIYALQPPKNKRNKKAYNGRPLKIQNLSALEGKPVGGLAELVMGGGFPAVAAAAQCQPESTIAISDN